MCNFLSQTIFAFIIGGFNFSLKSSVRKSEESFVGLFLILRGHFSLIYGLRILIIVGFSSKIEIQSLCCFGYQFRFLDRFIKLIAGPSLHLYSAILPICRHKMPFFRSRG